MGTIPTNRGQYHRMPSITPRFCELGLIRICPFEKNVSGDFDPPGDPPRCSIAGPPYHHWTCPRVRHRGGKHNCRAMSSTEFFDSERLEWLTLRCRSPFGPGTEDIHLFKVIDQLMACVKTFLFTCCGFFSQFIVSQAMQSLQYGEYSLIVLYNNIIIYLIIYYYIIYIYI